MADNPYVGAAANVAGSALHGAIALREAADQQQRLQQATQQKNLKDQFDTEVRMRQQGYSPYMETTGQDESGLKRRTTNPNAGPGNVVTDPFNRKWVAPDKGKPTQQQSFTDLRGALEGGAQPLDTNGNVWNNTTVPRFNDQGNQVGFGTHEAPPDPSQVMQIPGGPQVYMPTADQKAKAGLQNHLQQIQAEQDAQGVSLPPNVMDALAEHAGLPAGSLRGVRIPHEAAATVFSKMLSPEKPSQPKYDYKYNTDDQGRVTITRIGQDGKPEQYAGDKGWMPMAAGARIAATHKEAGGAPGAQDSDPKDIARGIMNGTQPPTVTGLYRNAAPVRAELARQGYDLMTATRDWQAVQRHLSTLNGAQQERLRQAISFTSESLDNIGQLYNEWKQYGRPSGVKIFNRGALKAAKNLPGKAGEVATALEAQINDLTSELGTVYKGGNASTDESLRLAGENLKADWNEQTFTRALDQIRKNLTIRRNSILNSQPVGVSSNSPYTPPTPGQQPQGGGGRGTPPVGTVSRGYRFKGGDPANPQSWEQVR